ncbi:hypothetical protein [Aurantiacibacter hainanensis]|uniref:hypothetical protein n=1 Tax=Aurantiacibacter hainanensis TaxID=3076114 RepID=UPI0030C73D40
MLSPDLRYFVQRLEREQVRLFSALSLHEEDSVMAKVDFYRRKLTELGARYDEIGRAWRAAVQPDSPVVPTNDTCDIEGANDQTSAHEWELRFQSASSGTSDRMQVKTADPVRLIAVVEQLGRDVEIRRDGRYICTMIGDRHGSGTAG